MGDRPSTGELLPGTLDMLILKTLSRGDLHGYGIAQTIERVSNDVQRVEEGALYPALHRLEVRGWLRSSWGTSENNRRAKYYSPTAAGQAMLKRETREWQVQATAIGRILKTSLG